MRQRENPEKPSRSSGSKIIIGLGNPGKAYERNRHNLGFMVVDFIASVRDVRFSRRCRSHIASYRKDGGVEICLAKPRTYMNNSGQAALSLMTRFLARIEDLMVVCDDINLPIGRLRLRSKGSSGGHRGLESVVSHLGSEGFARLRVGVGSPDGIPAEDYVLADFGADETDIVMEGVKKAAEALDFWAGNGISEAMNRYN